MKNKYKIIMAVILIIAILIFWFQEDLRPHAPLPPIVEASMGHRLYHEIFYDDDLKDEMNLDFDAEVQKSFPADTPSNNLRETLIGQGFNDDTMRRAAIMGKEHDDREHALVFAVSDREHIMISHWSVVWHEDQKGNITDVKGWHTVGIR